jgi:hypothetical protein
MKTIYYTEFLYDAHREIKTVAFYDRASTSGRQETNNSRFAQSDQAREVLEQYPSWQCIFSDDPRNGGVCFLDVGKGWVVENFDNKHRQFFMRLVKDERIDTILAFYEDRLYREKSARKMVFSLCKKYHKNLVLMLSSAGKYRRIQFEAQTRQAFLDFQRDALLERFYRVG